MKSIKILVVGLVILFASCNNNQQNQNKVSTISSEKMDTTHYQIEKPLSGKIETDSLPLKAKEFVAKNYARIPIVKLSYL